MRMIGITLGYWFGMDSSTCWLNFPQNRLQITKNSSLSFEDDLVATFRENVVDLETFGNAQETVLIKNPFSLRTDWPFLFTNTGGGGLQCHRRRFRYSLLSICLHPPPLRSWCLSIKQKCSKGNKTLHWPKYHLGVDSTRQIHTNNNQQNEKNRPKLFSSILIIPVLYSAHRIIDGGHCLHIQLLQFIHKHWQCCCCWWL